MEFRRAFELKLCGRQFPPPDTFFRFLIKKLSFRSRAAKLCQAFHDYRPFIRAAPDVEFVAEPHGPTRFGAGAVDFNFSAGDGVRGEGAGFKEPRRPEPLVDANGLAGLFHLLVVHRVVFVQRLASWPVEVGHVALLQQLVIRQIDLKGSDGDVTFVHGHAIGTIVMRES